MNAIVLKRVVAFRDFRGCSVFPEKDKSRNIVNRFTNYIEKLGVLGMKKENLAEVLWKTLVMGEITSDENKKQEISNIEMQIMDKKNDC